MLDDLTPKENTATPLSDQITRKKDFYKHGTGSDTTLIGSDGDGKAFDLSDDNAAFDVAAPPVKDLAKTMKDGVNDQQEGLVKLASAMKPIISKFDEVLVHINLSLSLSSAVLYLARDEY